MDDAEGPHKIWTKTKIINKIQIHFTFFSAFYKWDIYANTGCVSLVPSSPKVSIAPQTQQSPCQHVASWQVMFRELFAWTVILIPGLTLKLLSNNNKIYCTLSVQNLGRGEKVSKYFRKQTDSRNSPKHYAPLLVLNVMDYFVGPNSAT